LQQLKLFREFLGEQIERLVLTHFDIKRMHQ